MGETASARERFSAGVALRKDVPRRSHSEWRSPKHRTDPVKAATAGDAALLPFLLEERHARMADSPLAFLRGSAGLMASDLAHTAVTGLTVQLSGDAHLANFGAFASGERQWVFDLHHFADTLPGPWEWDLKRLAVSFTLAARGAGYSGKDTRMITNEVVSSYRGATARFAATPILDVWYSQLPIEDIRAALPHKADQRRAEREIPDTPAGNGRRALGRLVDSSGRSLRFAPRGPLLHRLGSLKGKLDPEAAEAEVLGSFAAYSRSLEPYKAGVLDRFRVSDIALKTVGVGSVATRCWLVLLQGRDHGDALVLQARQIVPAAAGPYLATVDVDDAVRIITGQRILESSADILLGAGADPGTGRSYLWRRFRHVATASDFAALDRERFLRYATNCGWALARAHARGGDPIAVEGYIGRGSGFDEAIIDFALSYADQVTADHAEFRRALRHGQLPGSNS